MHTNSARILAFCIFNLFCSSLQAEISQADQNYGIGVYIDQDLFVPFTNEDRDYTMGVALEFFWEKNKGFYPLDGLVRRAGEWVGIGKSDNDIVYSFMLGTLAYTPDDLADSEPIYDDRPYSSLIYLSNKRVLADHDSALAAEILLGVIGTNLARDAQTEFHKLYRSLADSDEPVEPMGWSHQISDGGELTLRLRLSNSRLHYSNPGLWDVASTLGVSLGFQTNISVSAAARLGHIKSPFWSLPFDPVNRGNFLPSKASNEWYFWAALRAHLVGYDALLQGQFRDSEVTYNSDEIERIVLDGAFGFTKGFGQSQITLSANTKSSDLKHSNRTQTWGSVNYIYHF